MSDSVRLHRRQPTRLPRPWDSPGKNTGVGCHFLLQCMKVKIESEVTQSRPTLRDPMDCSPPDSSVHGIFQARVLEWGAIAFSIHSPSLHQKILLRALYPYANILTGCFFFFNGLILSQVLNNNSVRYNILCRHLSLCSFDFFCHC